MNTKTRFESFRLSVLCVALLGSFPLLAEAAVAGRVQFVAGDVRILGLDGKERAAQKGQEVSEGETVLTGAGGSAQLKMIDGGVLAVRPGTQLKVDAYAFNGKEDGSENAAFSLVKGGLRAITGLIGNTNKEKYKFQTPTAVIGIRGTDHEPMVLLEGQAGAGSDTPPGTYDKVNVGATSLTTNAGTTVISSNQVGFAPSLNELPVLLPKLPSFYQATPAPLAKSDPKKAQGSAAATGEGSDAKAETKEAKSETDTVKAGVAASSLSGTDANGNVLNLAEQTLTTPGGQSLALSVDVLSKLKTNGNELIVGFPATESTGNFLYPAFFGFGGPDLVLTRDGAGNLIGAGSTDGGSGFLGSVSQSGSVLTDLGGSTASGLSWGRWQGGQVTLSGQYIGIDASGHSGLGALNPSGQFIVGATQTKTVSLGSGSLHWLTGVAATPQYLPQLLTGTANYSLLGGTRPTDYLGNTGTLNSASLAVNFSTQIVDAKIDFSIGGNNWNMQSNSMRLDGTHFSSHISCNPQCASTVGLSKNGIAVGSTPTPNVAFSFGNMNGMLMGVGLNTAGLQYSVQEMVPSTRIDPETGLPVTTFSTGLIQGVAGFSGTAQNVDTPFRAVNVTDGWGLGVKLGGLLGGSTVNLGSTYRGSVEGSVQPVARVVDSAAGLTEFVGRARGYTPLSSSQEVPGLFEAAPENTIRIGSALNRDVGSATIDGATVSWGRWEGGSVDIYSRDGTVKLGVIDNSSRSMHWLSTSALNTSALSLPLTGTATYTLAGNTNPTDLKGNTGTLASATLTADFANAKIDAGVKVSFNAPTNTSNWNMSATNVPLGPQGGFQSNTLLNGVGGITHTASCSGGGCGSQTIGYIDGHFISGGKGAVMNYGMATGTPSSGSLATATTGGAVSSLTPVIGVTGLAVMKR